jgi:hypothetical protein
MKLVPVDRSLSCHEKVEKQMKTLVLHHDQRSRQQFNRECCDENGQAEITLLKRVLEKNKLISPYQHKTDRICHCGYSGILFLVVTALEIRAHC